MKSQLLSLAVVSLLAAPSAPQAASGQTEASFTADQLVDPDGGVVVDKEWKLGDVEEVK